MKTIRAEQLERAIRRNPSGYLRDVLSVVHHWDEQGRPVLRDGDFMRLRRQYHGRGSAASKPEKPAGPGDHLHNLIVEHYDLKPCQRCREMMDRMNEWGPAECLRRIDEIAEDMYERRDQLKGWRKIAAKLPASKPLAIMEIKGLIRQACTEGNNDGG